MRYSFLLLALVACNSEPTATKFEIETSITKLVWPKTPNGLTCPEIFDRTTIYTGSSLFKDQYNLYCRTGKYSKPVPKTIFTPVPR